MEIIREETVKDKANVEGVTRKQEVSACICCFVVPFYSQANVRCSTEAQYPLVGPFVDVGGGKEDSR